MRKIIISLSIGLSIGLLFFAIEKAQYTKDSIAVLNTQLKEDQDKIKVVETKNLNLGSSKSTSNKTSLMKPTLDSLAIHNGLNSFFNEEKKAIGDDLTKIFTNNWVLCFTILGLLTGLYFQFRRMKKVRNSTKAMEAENTALQRANQQLEAQKLQLIALSREVHHRTKNNLQNIAAMLYMQEQKEESLQLKSIINETRSRIDAMGNIHKLLYKKEHEIVVSVKIKEYIEDLVSQVLDMNKDITKEVTKYLDIDEKIELKVDFSIQIGLIINELLQNIIKYALPTAAFPRFKIGIYLDKAKENLTIVVADNGIEYQKDDNENKINAFGSMLIKTLVDGRKGQISYNYEEGTTIVIQFPLFKNDTTITND